MQTELSELTLSPKELAQLRKLLSVFFLGQIVGLPTLNSILSKFEIKSNNYQVCYKKLCKKLSVSALQKIFDEIFEQQVLAQLSEMCEKDSSCWSRSLVTAVLDDSIFKTWLGNKKLIENFGNCHGRFFSGQCGRVVYGLKMVTFGLNIDGVFYPMYFDFVQKATETIKEVEKSTQVAQKLVKKWKKFTEKATKKGISIPKINFSCDSGYNDVDLSNECANAQLDYISVPSKAHLIEIEQTNGDVKRLKIREWIDEVFLIAEQEHQKNSTEPFFIRFRAKYCSQKRIVTFLAFRLKGSKKVCVIYSTNKNIHAKTLRRHWFQRTSIEQFFKLLKHTLLIQESRSHEKNVFFLKICRFAYVALHAQKLVRKIRKQTKGLFDKKGFISLQRMLNSDNEILDLLQSFLNVKY